MGKKEARCAEEMFCRGCGAMQPPAQGCNYFELLGMPEELFDLNPKQLEQRYKMLMAKLHPDRFMQKSQEEQSFSVAQCSMVNQAYATLKCPHARAVYMLRRLGMDFEEETSNSDPEFMMEIMEVSMEIDDAGADQSKLKDLKSDFFEPRMQQACREAAEAFARQDVGAAASVTARLQYLKRVGSLLHDRLQVQ
eukprot:CAMPEP_0184289406 /NCGR_PEP_ID=MMETSP1049-20130417/1874_1 /TAXON_ID=77928 /ORGANISM="Proteomonas sulcata, Strain CCMP704" /LENGTH=193 /DNA_ID=CAMNT_0026596207 /DNA_START=131 /DNA_END=712 /DNA_ORIENTATION=-